MPLSNSDLKLWWAINRPKNDTDASAGAIDNAGASSEPGWKPTFTQAPLSTSDTIQIVSDGADTRNVTVTTRKADGTPATSSPTAANGATPVDVTSLSTNNERLLEALVATLDAARTMTIQLKNGGTPIVLATIGPNEKGVQLMFYDASADPSIALKRYEVLYWKNHHSTLALNAAKARIASDLTPNGKLKQGIATAKGDVGALSNRLNGGSPPAGITFVGAGVDQSVPTNALGPGERVALYHELSSGAGDGVIRSSFTSQMAGTTV